MDFDEIYKKLETTNVNKTNSIKKEPSVLNLINSVGMKKIIILVVYLVLCGLAANIYLIYKLITLIF